MQLLYLIPWLEINHCLVPLKSGFTCMEHSSTRNRSWLFSCPGFCDFIGIMEITIIRKWGFAHLCSTFISLNVLNGLITLQCCSWLNSKIFLSLSPRDHCHSSPRAASSGWLIKPIQHSSTEHWPVIVVSWSGDQDTRNMSAYYKLLGAGKINCWVER